MALAAQIDNALLRQRGGLIEWVPVCLAIGVGIYFSIDFEPDISTLIALALCAGLGLLVAPQLSEARRPLLIGIALIVIGMLIIAARAHSLAGPVLSFRYYGPIEGRIIELDRSASDALRVTLDQVWLQDVSPKRTPKHVRVSLHGDAAEPTALVPGQRVMTTGHLAPPGGQVEPGGFDFQRHAWFMQLGAVGYTRVPIVSAGPPDEAGIGLAIFRLRMAISDYVRGVLPGDTGGFAAAVTTGDRSGISQTIVHNLRASNTAHLLAISGLHMGLLSAFVFALVRGVLALIPWTALHWPGRKIAAITALLISAFYLAMSGGNVATERAFIMVAVALFAVLLERRVFSLRAVAVAAVLILLLRPESLASPGFQMSFAATTALIAFFGWHRHQNAYFGPAWIRGTIAVVMASAISGLATAPVGAAHFNTLASYGLLANVLSVPLMGILIIPAAVLAALLVPVGLQWIGLHIMGLGVQWLLGVAAFVANLPGAQHNVPGPPYYVLPILALGMLFFTLWRGRGRYVGVIVAIAGLGLWNISERPVLLISDNGGLVGLLTDKGRALSRARGAGFVAQNWLENDGDGASQEIAAARWRNISPSNVWRAAMTGPVHIIHGTGKRAAAAPPPCKAGQILVTNSALSIEHDGCDVFDINRLRRTGAVAFIETASGYKIHTARAASGERLWSNWSK